MEVGDTFKEFALPNQYDKVIKSADLADTPFVMFAYPRALTSGCTKEVCSLRDNFKILTDRGFKIFGISNDKPAKNLKFSDKHELQYDLLSDVDSKFLEAIGTYGEKNIYGKKSMGTFRYTYIVDKEFKIAKIFKKVKTDIHGSEIIDAIDKLGM